MSGLRLAVGTFTILPAGRIDHVDRSTARTAMSLAPLVGIVLGAIAALMVWAVAATSIPYADLLGAALAIALLAYLTRALHLDGLADTADALGSGRSGGDALDIARRGDVGPFGVIAIVLVLLIDVVALSSATAAHLGVAAAIVAVTTGRLAAVWACVRGIPAARPEGLGAMVAGTVPLWRAIAWTLAVAVLAVGLAWASGGRTALVLAAAPVAVVAGLLVSLGLVRRCVRRLGGITGDVLGASIESATAAALVVIALASAGTTVIT